MYLFSFQSLVDPSSPSSSHGRLRIPFMFLPLRVFSFATGGTPPSSAPKKVRLFVFSTLRTWLCSRGVEVRNFPLSALNCRLWTGHPEPALADEGFAASGKPEVGELVAAVFDYLVVVDPHVAISRQHVNVRPGLPVRVRTTARSWQENSAERRRRIPHRAVEHARSSIVPRSGHRGS